MLRKRLYLWLGISAGLVLILGGIALGAGSEAESGMEELTAESAESDVNAAPVRAEEEKEAHPMSIQNLREADYPGGRFVVEETLADGSSYSQAIVSYRSEGLKIRGLLTIPLAEKPEGGFPAILFVHGYIPPAQYDTVRNYAGYQARLARSGFITFKPDLRGHGQSEGTPVSAHYSEKYVIDTLFALSYLKKHPDVNPDRIGYWGHSNGGEIGLRMIVVSPDVKAASFWAGVVGSYEDMFETYNSDIRFLRNASESELVRENGLPGANTDFWSTIDPYYHLGDISAPVQILHGTADESVPVVLSRRLNEELEKSGKIVDYHEYPGDNHNISANVSAAFNRSISFFRQYL